jgi:peptidoglycan biosynthesis protein MviN/MurJ (putative lipid II flippase)
VQIGAFLYPPPLLLLVGASLFGQLLGFIRTQIINGNFNSPGHITTDAYFAAFKIPDFFFYTIAAGALGRSFYAIFGRQIRARMTEKLFGSLLQVFLICLE